MSRNVVVTGGSQGIGRKIAEAFLAEGDRVVITSRREEPAQKFLSEASTDRLFYLNCDCATEEGAKALYEFTKKSVGVCDVLVNNAAIFIGGPIHKTSVADFDKQMGIDVRGVFLICKAFLPDMLEKKSGNIINIASLAALNGAYNMTVYAMAKAAIGSMTKSMAIDYGRDGIRVNGICPSATRTEMFVSGNTQEVFDLFDANNPMGRIGKPEEIADAAVFLASDKASYITGQLLSVDGGLSSWNGEPKQSDGR